MKVSGFTFLRNGSLLGYPYLESIRSALPLCDEFVVAVGESEDDTLERLRAMNEPKLRLIETRWNERMQDRGYVYAQQKMIAQFNCDGDWAFYLEGDEVLHERDLEAVRSAMRRHLEDRRVEALVFDYHHFFGSPQWLAVGPGCRRSAGSRTPAPRRGGPRGGAASRSPPPRGRARAAPRRPRGRRPSRRRS